VPHHVSPDAHAPASQTSGPVHASPSLHAAPSSGANTQPEAGTQASVVQGLPSEQVAAI
jgi:hypothetical protein